MTEDTVIDLDEQETMAIQNNAWLLIMRTDRLWESAQKLAAMPNTGNLWWTENNMGGLGGVLLEMLKVAIVVQIDGWRERNRVAALVEQW